MCFIWQDNHIFRFLFFLLPKFDNEFIVSFYIHIHLFQATIARQSCCPFNGEIQQEYSILFFKSYQYIRFYFLYN